MIAIRHDDQAGCLTDLTHRNRDSFLLADYDLTYDTVNRLTQFTSLLDGTATYVYDARDQLLDATYVGGNPNPPPESYTYDDNGNRMLDAWTSQSADGTDNQVQTDGTYDYLYDAEGNRIRRTHIASGAVTEYTWDHRNRLVTITDRVSLGGGITREVEYAYDAFDRRISMTADPDGAGAQSAWSEIYVYDGDHIALVFEDADGPGGQAPVLSQRVLHGPMVDMVLAQEDVTKGLYDPDRTRWALGDHLGSVRDVMDSTPGNTMADNHIQYDAYGSVISETNSAVDFLFGYTGRETDEESDLNYYRARYYDPELGRFISKDWIGFTAGDANQYRYVGNGPTNATDPSGLEELGWGEFVYPGMFGLLPAYRKGVELDRQLGYLQLRRAQSKHGFALIEDLERINRHNRQQVVKDATALARGCVEFNAAALGGGFLAGTFDDIARQAWRSDPASYYTYSELRVMIRQSGLSSRGSGLEAHHLLERQFAARLGLRQADIISVPLTPQWHRNVGGFGSNLDAAINTELRCLGSTPADANAEIIWQAHRNVYLRHGYREWAEAIYEAYFRRRGIAF